MGFGKGVSVDMPPTHPLCRRCHDYCFGHNDCGHPCLAMDQIRQVTLIMIDLGIMKTDDMVKCGNNKQVPATCFVHCRCLTIKQRTALVQSATYRRTIQTMPARPKSVQVLLAERNRAHERPIKSVNERVLADVVNKGAYGIGSDLND